MYIAKCIDLQTQKYFEKEFWDKKKFENFKNKCRFSRKIMIYSTIDNSKFYD